MRALLRRVLLKEMMKDLVLRLSETEEVGGGKGGNREGVHGVGRTKAN